MAGSESETACTCNNGYYRPRLAGIDLNGDDNRDYSAACQICPADKFCFEGSLESCHTQSASPVQSDSSDDCTCNAGYYSNDQAQDKCNYCEPKFWCSGGTHREQCPTKSESPAGSFTIEACVCEGGYKRTCAHTASDCDVDWTEICTECLAGEICEGGVMLHCPDHSTTPSAGNDDSANCVCNVGFASP